MESAEAGAEDTAESPVKSFLEPLRLSSAWASTGMCSSDDHALVLNPLTMAASSASAFQCACRGARGEGAGWDELYALGIGGNFTAEYVYNLEVRPTRCTRATSQWNTHSTS